MILLYRRIIFYTLSRTTGSLTFVLVLSAAI